MLILGELSPPYSLFFETQSLPACFYSPLLGFQGSISTSGFRVRSGLRPCVRVGSTLSLEDSFQFSDVLFFHGQLCLEV